MANPPETRASLLARVRDRADGDAWGQFVELYGPLLYRWGRRHGLQDADAADLAQEVLRSAVAALPGFTYDRGRGRFRGWLLTVAANRLRDWRASPRRAERGSGDTDVQRRLEAVAAPDEEAWWESEYQRSVFVWAAERVRGEFRPATWQAFWRTAVEGCSGEEAGRELGLSPGAVHVARSRVLARLKQVVHEQLEQ